VAKYDVLVVGCGISGAVCAERLVSQGKRVVVIEKRSHIGGNCYTENISGINVHKYGPHVFHTDNESVWRYVCRFAEFNHFVNRPKVFYKGKLYSFPINLMTLHQLWGVRTPAEAEAKLRSVAVPISNPSNLEEWAVSQVGEEIYRIFIEGYTTKQWGKAPSELPADIIKRIPIRLTLDDNYYTDEYQGVPKGGYTDMFERMLAGVEVVLETDYFDEQDYWNAASERVIYTGRIDEYFDYRFGVLEYRALRFEQKILEGDYQGNAVINYPERRFEYTRVIEHKHFEFGRQPQTVVTWEYPAQCGEHDTPYYPVNTPENNRRYERYREEARKDGKVVMVGRLGTYSYMDMDDAVLAALRTVDTIGE